MAFAGQFIDLGPLRTNSSRCTAVALLWRDETTSAVAVALGLESPTVVCRVRDGKSPALADKT